MMAKRKKRNRVTYVEKNKNKIEDRKWGKEKNRR